MQPATMASAGIGKPKSAISERCARRGFESVSAKHQNLGINQKPTARMVVTIIVTIIVKIIATIRSRHQDQHRLEKPSKPPRTRNDRFISQSRKRSLFIWKN